jgi:hypothetical protein
LSTDRRTTTSPGPSRWGLRPIVFGSHCEGFRERLAQELVAERVAEAKALDMLVAATEVVNNAHEHGGGVEEIRVGRGDSPPASG